MFKFQRLRHTIPWELQASWDDMGRGLKTNITVISLVHLF